MLVNFYKYLPENISTKYITRLLTKYSIFRTLEVNGTFLWKEPC